MDHKKGKTKVESLNKVEMNKLIDSSLENDFYYLIFTLARKTGRRLGEYYNCKVKDIDFDRQILLTQVLKQRKRVYKEAILNPELCNLLRRHIRMENLKEEDYLFRKVSYRAIQYAVKKYAKKAGIEKNVVFHNFRHYFITELFKKGWTYDKIAKLTGHSNIDTLKHYDHTVASDLSEKAREDIADI